MKISSPFSGSPLLAPAIALVVLAVGLTISPCLQSFYYSEDLIQTYLANLSWTTHPELLLERLYMPWIQCSNMGLFYRPVIDLSFLLNSLIHQSGLGSGALAVVSHLTNMACHITSSVLCLLITRLMLKNKAGDTTATLTGLVAALLFGFNPLQDETIYWLVCRCDGLCTMFSLLSFYLSLCSFYQSGRPRANLLLALSVVACLAGILAKEQAVFMPFVIVLYTWLFRHERGATATGTSGGRSETIRFALPFFTMLALYSLVRIGILGGIGGYHGSIGAVLNASFLKRFTAPLVWNKLFYPLDEEIFSAQNAPQFYAYWPILFSLAYATMALGAFIGLKGSAWKKTTGKALPFLLAAILIVLLPTYQSFVVIETLFGGRCSYLAQAFCSIALAIVLGQIKPPALRNIFIPLYLLLLASTNVINGQAWVKRGDNLRAFQKEAKVWAQKSSAERKLCLVNMPLDCRELSSVYDLEQLRCLFRPPINDLKNGDLSDRLVQPSYLRMQEDAVNRRRLNELSRSGLVDFVVSSVALGKSFAVLDNNLVKENLQTISTTSLTCRPLEEQKKASPSKINQTSSAMRIDLSKLDRPQQGDCLTVTIAPERSALPEDKKEIPIQRAMPVNFCPQGKTLVLSWYSDLTNLSPWINWSTASFIDDGRERQYIFPLADRISWKLASKVYAMLLPNVPTGYRVSAIELKGEDDLTPTISASASGNDVNHETFADGFYPVNDRDKLDLTWQAERLKAAGAVSAMVEISQIDLSFAHLAGGFREFEACRYLSRTMTNLPLDGSVKLSRGDFGKVGKYELRLAAVNQNGATVGFFSDPIAVMVTDRPFSTSLEKALFNLRAQRGR